MGSYLSVTFVPLLWTLREQNPKLFIFVIPGIAQCLIMVGTQFAFLNSGFKMSVTCLRYNEKNPRGKLRDLSSSPESVLNKLYNLGCIISSLCTLGSSLVQ